MEARIPEAKGMELGVSRAASEEEKRMGRKVGMASKETEGENGEEDQSMLGRVRDEQLAKPGHPGHPGQGDATQKEARDAGEGDGSWATSKKTRLETVSTYLGGTPTRPHRTVSMSVAESCRLGSQGHVSEPHSPCHTVGSRPRRTLNRVVVDDAWTGGRC